MAQFVSTSSLLSNFFIQNNISELYCDNIKVHLQENINYINKVNTLVFIRQLYGFKNCINKRYKKK